MEHGLVVVALGGNALAPPSEPFSLGRQRERIARTARLLAPVAEQHPLVLTHGNGPQVGLLAAHEALVPAAERLPLDLLVAESEAMVGEPLQAELANALAGVEVVTLLTHTVVAADDPAFAEPTKPIGPVLDDAEMQRLHDEHGWAFVADGDGWRRVVASPEPLDLLETRAIRRLVTGGVVVVAAGGGGVPVVAGTDGRLRGVEAVVDKDLASAVLAEQLGAGTLLLLTDVDALYEGYGTPTARAIRAAHVDELFEMELPEGSMGPKVEACCRFVEATGGFAAIGALDQALAVLRGAAGTRVLPGTGPIEYV